MEKSIINGSAHIGLYVKDIEKTKSFYTSILGFEVVFEITSGIKTAFLRNNDLTLECIQMPDDPIREIKGRIEHIAFEVKNIEEVVEHLKEKGIAFEGDIYHAKNFWDNGAKWILFRGPDGEHLELNEVL